MAIVSFTRNFIFVKTRKTAGTSVQESLVHSCAAGDVATMVWTNVLSSQPSPIQEFASLAEIELEYSVSRNDFFTFGFTRNPYALVLSRYLYEVRMGRLEEQAGRGNFNRWVQQVYFTGQPGFPDGRYVKDRSRLLLFGEDMQPSVDYIGRFETLQQDYTAILRRIAWSQGGGLSHVNTSNRQGVHYRDWLDPASKALIERHFDFELDFFAYRFDG